MWIIYQEIKMGAICLKIKMGTKGETEDVEGDRSTTAQMDMVVRHHEFQPNTSFIFVKTNLFFFFQAMEHNFRAMVLNHQSHHQAQECPMEPEDLPWAGGGLWLPIEINGVGWQ